jgi:hypothetical protein
MRRMAWRAGHASIGGTITIELLYDFLLTRKNINNK